MQIKQKLPIDHPIQESIQTKTKHIDRENGIEHHETNLKQASDYERNARLQYNVADGKYNTANDGWQTMG